ncbi:hypothetical protein [Fangia hongkongensis]|uniref:hypothetical protein n=1 Tax=Fangia hongkongensis TaxID=270495 RepID=UPI00037B106D|nr:hypothetical protein [Fangia hongkongensis]MBK2124880.1 hypothetical protein [Fangia hongkongensis]
MKKTKLAATLSCCIAVMTYGNTFSDLTNCGSNGKCNIHFNNHTGEEVSIDGRQTTALATTVKVDVFTSDDTKVGNSISMLVNDSNTLNLSTAAHQKGNHIELKAENLEYWACLKFNQVKKIVSNNNNCGIYSVFNSYYGDSLYIHCDSGTVVSNGPDSCM